MSFTSHLYSAFHGDYSSVLVKLDQLTLTLSGPLAGWGLSRSKLLTGVLALIPPLMVGLLLFGPDDATPRSCLISAEAIIYLSPMLWARRDWDPSLTNTVLVLAMSIIL